jgi:CP family cyanate transporter-like MFS transporter
MSATRAPIPVNVVVGLFLASLALRPQLLAVGPLLPFIRDDLGLPASIAGLITTIPVLCMGLFAPIGPRIAARLGPRMALASALLLIAGFGLLRAAVPNIVVLLTTTFGVGVGIGIAGAVPAMVVSLHLPTRRALGTGAYAGGIVTGSALAATIAVPLAIDGNWQRSLAILAVATLIPLGSWLWFVRSDGLARIERPRAMRLPWRAPTAWLLVLAFGVQSMLYYGVVAWLPNSLVERGWTAEDAGLLLGAFNAIGLVTTLGVPMVTDRVGTRRSQLLACAGTAIVAFLGISLLPDLTVAWVALAGLALGAIFPLVLTVPLDVAGDPAHVGAAAAFMFLGGYALSSLGPVILGGIRDASGDFSATLWSLVVLAVVFFVVCLPLSTTRLRRGVPSTEGQFQPSSSASSS